MAAPMKKKPKLGELAAKTANKTALAGVLKQMDDQELAAESAKSMKFYQRSVAKSVSSHGHQDTPYGKVIQRISIGPLGAVEIVDPAAWLWYMAVISPSFNALMKSLVSNVAQPFRIVLYNDALIPGNPFRPDKGRVMETFYWVVADWPDWVLSRTFCWPVCLIIRKIMVAKVEGGCLQ